MAHDAPAVGAGVGVGGVVHAGYRAAVHREGARPALAVNLCGCVWGGYIYIYIYIERERERERDRDRDREIERERERERNTDRERERERVREREIER